MKQNIYIIIFIIIIIVVIVLFLKNNESFIENNKPSYITYDTLHKGYPKNTFYPKTLNEIQDIVLENSGRKIRVSGGNHTFNTISLSPDIIIRMTNMKNIINMDPLKQQITVESGITIGELTEYLETYNLALHVLPAIPYQTIGGIIGTSSHGSRFNKGSLSDEIVNMTVVLADGTIKNVHFDDIEFPAFSTSLGALGVIYSVTLQCEPLYSISHTRLQTTWKNVMNNITNINYINEYPYMQLYIYPFTKNLKTIIYKRKPIYDENIIEIDKTKNRDISFLDTQTGIYRNVLTKNEEIDFYTEIEIAIPFNDTLNAVNDVISLLLNHKKLYKYESNKPILVRFTGPDNNSWLSMASGRQTTFISIFREGPFNDEKRNKQTTKLFKEFEKLLIYKYNGRPHWGKQNFLTKHKMEKLYGMSLDYFNKIRKQVDPQNMFTNKYIQKRLGK